MEKCFNSLNFLFRKRPDAVAVVSGSESFPNIRGRVLFYGSTCGVTVVSEITGLPRGGQCQKPVFAFHIHVGDECIGNDTDPFANADGHYNPNGCAHPYHAGDLPSLFGANGRAFSAVLTDRFTVREIIGKTVIIHSRPDDFTTQPAGNAGEKIACGVIKIG